MTANTRTYHFQALNDIWTGSVQPDMKKNKLNTVPNRFVQTGLLGSIRWWFEVVIRGLGGDACDPINSECKDSKHCIVCELFGCTGWARKFRFQVFDDANSVKELQINKNNIFNLQFTPLRPINDEEWTLLDLTLRIIAEYGAVGGKTVFKPSTENGRENKLHHQDFGKIKLQSVKPRTKPLARIELEQYVRADRWLKVKINGFTWASLNNFWVVNRRYLARQNQNDSTFNSVIKRPEKKTDASQNDSFLAGRRPYSYGKIAAESKKVFSFKQPPSTFGFIDGESITFDEIKDLLKTAWGDMQDNEFVKGNEILDDFTRRGQS